MANAISKPDEEVQLDVMEELKWDGHVNETAIGVEVEAGVVTLTGTVPSWAARVAAREAAHRVSGVLDVADDIRVEPHGSAERTDTDIAHAVRTALEWDVRVPDRRIQSTVSNGVVTLDGDVDTWTEHGDAAYCVRNLAGVVEVRNHLVVEPGAPLVAPGAIRSAIHDALERHTARAVKHVNIDVVGDKVTLSGDVQTWTEREAIEGAARGTKGVRMVENHMTIRA